MANHLKMALIETIQSLHQRGWSQRRIAVELNLNRETVARHLRLAGQSKPAIAPPGSAPFPTKVGRPSDCQAWHAILLMLVQQGLSAQRIFQDLTRDHGYTGSYYSVRRFVQKLESKTELPFRRIETAAGEEAQIDFGTGAPLVRADGTRQRTHVFRVVLSHSRKAYSEVVARQTTEQFLRALENAFWRFGGVPRRIVLDNLRAAVPQADWFDPELNPKVQSFAAHYGTVFLPTHPRMPRHKGKVEKGIDYVQANARDIKQLPGGKTEGERPGCGMDRATVVASPIGKQYYSCVIGCIHEQLAPIQCCARFGNANTLSYKFLFKSQSVNEMVLPAATACVMTLTFRSSRSRRWIAGISDFPFTTTSAD